jgi:hypothetical protein
MDRNIQEDLDLLTNAPTKLSDTAYGQFEEQKRRDIEQGYTKMSCDDSLA